MSKFLVEPTASMCVGNTCATCNTHKHERGFVNLLIDRLGIGRFYVCAGCADEIGRAVGGHDPRQVAEAREREEEYVAALAAKDVEIAAAQAAKVVPLVDVMELLADRAAKKQAPAKATA